MTSQSPDYFDAFAASWEQNYADPVFQDRLRVYRDWLAPQAGGGDDARAAFALDLGCGTFPSHEVYARLGLRAVGVDVSAAMVAQAARLGRPSVRYDGRRLPFADASFSHVTMVNMLEFVEDPDALWGELARVCRPDARVLLTLNNVDSLLKRAMRVIRRNPSWGRFPRHVHNYTGTSLAALLRRHHFSAPRVFACTVPSVHHWAPKLLSTRAFRHPWLAENVYYQCSRVPSPSLDLHGR